jgi:hypothetical protein
LQRLLQQTTGGRTAKQGPQIDSEASAHGDRGHDEERRWDAADDLAKLMTDWNNSATSAAATRSSTAACITDN